MKYWNDLDGSVFFNKVFSAPVAIGVVQLFAITIDNNTPNVILEFDITELPDMPPEKWKKNGFNTCRIGINISNIKNLHIKNVPTKENLVAIISKPSNTYIVQLSNKDSLIEFTAQHILLCGPSVYINSTTEV
ncbi:Imm50 family immunity protein [Pseudomonas sp. CCC3.1]|uniref:Imm50 family immunity protein n=1 Tax=Pseudomonas sp. CCC3.1 TaxID=3048607 RepID=UPI002AC9E2C8|nr:Imm50 family immunity protein [Pseudomonas sp. CCC3.1]MEB0207475.1 Imm50 family immunity protein [Pseudomonas sp. CCC3.1]WPX37826.1 Imm50 family immunity protein [Pseudomonas sp. CCC3.1]